jgi:hypothetical protein
MREILGSPARIKSQLLVANSRHGCSHPEQADRWTWLILAAYAQLLLARGVVADRRLPWERPLAVEKLTPCRVLRSFVTLVPLLDTPAEAPKPRGRSPGRPKETLSGPARRYPALKKAA